MTITASADGSALGNPGPMGWAWYINDEQWAAGGSPHGTNNIGELTAVLELLRSTKVAGKAGEDLVVMCDSQYVINSITKWMPGWKRKGWKKSDGKPVLNVELMKALDVEMKGRNVRFEWVKGHAGHRMNEAADERARAAATAYQRGQAPKEGPGMGLAPSASPSPAAPEPASKFAPDSPSAVHEGPLLAPVSPDSPGESEATASTSSAAGAAAPSAADSAPLDLFSGFDELRARRERREREGFDDPCATTLSAVDAERALWEPDELRAAGGPPDPGVGRREAVLSDGVQLIDSDGNSLAPREWARLLAYLAQGGNGYAPASVSRIQPTDVARDLTLVDAEVNADGRNLRVTSLWSMRAGGAELVLHRWSDMR